MKRPIPFAATGRTLLAALVAVGTVASAQPPRDSSIRNAPATKTVAPPATKAVAPAATKQPAVQPPAVQVKQQAAPVQQTPPATKTTTPTTQTKTTTPTTQTKTATPTQTKTTAPTTQTKTTTPTQTKTAAPTTQTKTTTPTQTKTSAPTTQTKTTTPTQTKTTAPTTQSKTTTPTQTKTAAPTTQTKTATPTQTKTAAPTTQTKAATPPATQTKAATPPATQSKTAPAPGAQTRAPAGGRGALVPTAPRGDTALGAPLVMMREVFEYERDGRRDPFVSLLSTTDLRPTLSDLKLLMTVVDEPGRSVALVNDAYERKQKTLRVGTRLGRMRVSSIRSDAVVFTIEEFGTNRRDSLLLRDSTRVRGR